MGPPPDLWLLSIPTLTLIRQWLVACRCGCHRLFYEFCRLRAQGGTPYEPPLRSARTKADWLSAIDVAIMWIACPLFAAVEGITTNRLTRKLTCKFGGFFQRQARLAKRQIP